MSAAHLLMDCCLWFVAFCWFVSFLARHSEPTKRNRKLPPPSTLCERTGEWRMSLPGLGRRQGD